MDIPYINKQTSEAQHTKKKMQLTEDTSTLRLTSDPVNTM